MVDAPAIRPCLPDEPRLSVGTGTFLALEQAAEGCLAGNQTCAAAGSGLERLEGPG